MIVMFNLTDVQLQRKDVFIKFFVELTLIIAYSWNVISESVSVALIAANLRRKGVSSGAYGFFKSIHALLQPRHPEESCDLNFVQFRYPEVE